MTTNIKDFPGVSLSSADFREKRVLFTEWDPRAEYAWDAGVAIGRYLAELREGRLLGTSCRHCRRTNGEFLCPLHAVARTRRICGS